jgi:hypothetical protein
LDWVLYLVVAVAAGAGAAVCLVLFLRRRRHADMHVSAAPSSAPGHGDPAGAAGIVSGAPVPARKHIPPRIVSTSGPPPPRPRALDHEPRPELPGAQPKVAREASEEE